MELPNKLWTFVVSLFFLVLPIKKYGQEDSTKPNIQEVLHEYHSLPRESLFLHLNKTEYVSGEELWFAGYVFNTKEQKPFKKTSNVYIGVYDSIGDQVRKGAFLSVNGYVKGNIKLDSTYSPGTYYIKGMTNWMRNFKESDVFVQKIKILDQRTSMEKNRSIESDLDVQFLPEGGNGIVGVSNSIGVKILNTNGFGVSIKNGRILNSKGELVTKFSTNKYGLGKFELFAEPNETYSAHVNLLDKEINVVPLPSMESKGINIKLNNNPNASKVVLVFSANQSTYDDFISKSSFFFLIHKDGVANKVPVEFDPETYTSTFFLDKTDLMQGVNTITLFHTESERPLLERMFFIRPNDSTKEMRAWAGSYANGDSLNITVSGEMDNSQLSVSVLPEGTLAYNPQENILSRFLLKPYLKGYIENPRYYFENVTARTDYELDLLLLTQGWSRYEWTSIFSPSPKANYDFEDGMLLSGSLNRPAIKNGGQIFIKDTKNHGSQFISLNEENPKFILTSFFPENEEKISFSYVNRRGKFIRPNISISITNKMTEDKVSNLWEDNLSFTTNENLDGPTSRIQILDKTIFLDEVVVTEEKKVVNNNPNVPAFLRSRVNEITSKTVFDFPRILDLFRANGYDVRTTLPNTTNNISAGNFDRVRIQSRRDRRTPTVYLDGIPLPSLDVLLDLPTGQLESYYIDRIASREGVRGGLGEVIYLFTRRGKEIDSSKAKAEFSTTFSYTVTNGYEKAKTFYMPKYRTFLNDAFKSYGVIHWEPELKIDGDGKGNFKILNTGLSRFILHIEGMSSSGELLSTKTTVDVRKINGK